MRCIDFNKKYTSEQRLPNKIPGLNETYFNWYLLVDDKVVKAEYLTLLNEKRLFINIY